MNLSERNFNSNNFVIIDKNRLITFALNVTFARPRLALRADRERESTFLSKRATLMRATCFALAGLLFHRGVLMSGSALSPWALVRGAANYAMQVAKHLNCSSVSTGKHICLNVAPEIIRRASVYKFH